MKLVQFVLLLAAMTAVSDRSWAEEPETCTEAMTPVQCFQAGLKMVGTALGEFRKKEAALQKQIQDLSKMLPPGAVVAFASDNGCPDGWQTYKPALSRMIIGASSVQDDRDTAKANGLTPRDAKTKGGEENHVLTVAEMPPHSHAVYPHAGVIVGTGGSHPGAGSADQTPTSRTNGDTSVVGGGTPHNTMPPYVALFYCVRQQ